MTNASTALQHQRDTERALVMALELGCIGYEEIPAATTLATNIRSGRGLTADQARAAWRILHRCGNKLAQVGIELPTNEPPKPAPTISEDKRPKLVIRPDGRIGASNVPFRVKDQVKAALGARWDKPREEWHVPASPAYAAGLASILSDLQPIPSMRVAELIAEHRTRASARLVLDPDSPVPQIDTTGLVTGQLWDHQARSVAFASAATASMIAVPMGGGKTLAAVATANNTDARRVIILCPNKVRGVWPREIEKWSAKSWHIVDGKRPAKRRGGRPQDLSIVDRVHQTESALFDCTCGAHTHAAVWNYEMLTHAPASTWRPAAPLDLVIFDEIHRLKSPTGAMSKNAAEWVAFTRRRIGLTGTPMPQTPVDIFGSYRALDPGIFGSIWTPFKAEYALTRQNAQGGEFIVGIQPGKRQQMADKVHSIMYRPTIDLKLPGCTHTDHVVELEPVARKEYDSLDKELWADLSAFAVGEATESDSETLTPKNILSRMIRLAQFTGGTVPNDEGELRRVSTAKTDALEEILDEIGCVKGAADGPEPVVVYCQYRADLDAVKGVAQKAGLRYGEISGRRSDGLTDRSEMPDDVDVLGVQIQSGGTGVDLTRARYGIWYSVGYSLGDYDQALKRQDRPGQMRPVVFIHLLAADTVDGLIYRALQNRRSVVASVIEARGIDPTAVGFAAPEQELGPEEFDGGIRRAAGVSLPGLDELRPVQQPRQATRKTAGLEDVDADLLAEYGLTGFAG